MRNALQKHKTGDKIKWIVTLIVGLGLVACVIGLTVRLNNNEKTKEVSATFGYETGLLDAETGRDKSGATAWRTKDFVPVKGLVIDIDEKSGDVSYNIFYYDEDKAFISKTSAALKVDYTASEDSSLPADAKYVRIVFEHANDTDISSSDIRTYCKEITVTYDK
ncbi:MAG: hypothetical protein ACI4RO_05230 [Candidatus Scatosoma sp.]